MIVEDPNLRVRIAHDAHDLLGAQRLRYRVFVEELGGDGALVDHARRLERDAFDPHFDHLILVDIRKPTEALDHVVGAYRLLPSDRLAQVGRFYSEDEYDLSVLKSSGRSLLELGRSCVDRAHRGGTAMYQMWSALAGYIRERKIEVLFGVASFHGTDTSTLAQPLSYLHHRHLAPPDLRVRAVAGAYEPMDVVPADRVDRVAAMRATPTLIKSYLRLGGFVGDGAFIDRPFNTTDVCLILDTARLDPRAAGMYTR
ncbi:MAG: GNAT family N-acetyltransferase [Shimia sp.]